MPDEGRAEKARQRAKRWYAANRARASVTQQIYNAAHRKENVASAMAWARAHPERVKATRKRYHERHKEEIRARFRAYVKANPEKRRAVVARSVFKCRWKGFTHDDRDALLSSQGGRCACCGDPILRRPQLDHCHRTGRIRGVLCTNCNLTLGNAKDDVDRLRAAIAYLTRNASGAAQHQEVSRAGF